MRSRSICLLVALAFWGALPSFLALRALGSQKTTSSIEDKPVSVKSSEDTRKVDNSIRPYVEKARRTYPRAKKRYLRGLPPGHTFFVTTKVHDDGRYETVFVAVKQIKDGTISGLIWNDILLVKKYKLGDVLTFPESKVIDWTITRPDGSEEGNFVGKFLDAGQNK